MTQSFTRRRHDRLPADLGAEELFLPTRGPRRDASRGSSREERKVIVTVETKAGRGRAHARAAALRRRRPVGVDLERARPHARSASRAASTAPMSWRGIALGTVELVRTFTVRQIAGPGRRPLTPTRRRVARRVSRARRLDHGLRSPAGSVTAGIYAVFRPDARRRRLPRGQRGRDGLRRRSRGGRVRGSGS